MTRQTRGRDLTTTSSMVVSAAKLLSGPTGGQMRCRGRRPTGTVSIVTSANAKPLSGPAAGEKRWSGVWYVGTAAGGETSATVITRPMAATIEFLGVLSLLAAIRSARLAGVLLKTGRLSIFCISKMNK